MTAPDRVMIGVEVHVRLATRTKLFCPCPSRFGAAPNSLVCPVCLGLPGALPVLSGEALRLGLVAAAALDMEVPAVTRFDRKHFFYPDLPKGYQITQYEAPLATDGAVRIEGDRGGSRDIGIERIHLEEDTGMSRHADEDATLLDLNRAGAPLLEIVGRPVLRSPAEAIRYLSALRHLLVFSGVTDAAMEKGHLRVEPNVNLVVTDAGEEVPTPVVEIKNLNSEASMSRAIRYEIERQRKEWRETRRRGGPGEKTTRGFDEARGVTVLQRGKEEAEDYRYFPEPDLPPVAIPAETVARVRAGLPEPPRARRERFERRLGIPTRDAMTLTSTPELADYFEAAVGAAGEAHARACASFVLVDVLRRRGAGFPAPPAWVGELVRLVAEGVVTRETARQEVWPAVTAEGRRPSEVVARRGLEALPADALARIVRDAIAASPEAVAAWRAGKEAAIGPVVGRAMAETRGRADAREVRRRIEEELRHG